jgi:hypothetical protein
VEHLGQIGRLLQPRSGFGTCEGEKFLTEGERVAGVHVVSRAGEPLERHPCGPILSMSNRPGDCFQAEGFDSLVRNEVRPEVGVHIEAADRRLQVDAVLTDSERSTVSPMRRAITARRRSRSGQRHR